MNFVTKRVPSAWLLKINDLRNELSDLQVKLEDLQKENKTLKRLQFRQEKALNKFEDDTENEISRHSNEIRTLRDHLRKSQEREKTTATKLKDREDELYRTKSILQRLNKLSEDKHLAERDDLARKLVQAEGQLDNNDRRKKDLQRKLELSNSSFQRHLLGERKKAYKIKKENKTLQEEHHRLTQKLKEKELDAKNIYAFRMSKKGTDVTPRKKATSQNVTTSVQTECILPAELLSSPLFPFALSVETDQKEHETVVRKEEENVERVPKEEADHLRQEREWLERKRESEEKLKRDQEQQALEEKAQKLRDEWEKEEFERLQKENSSFLGNVEKEEKVTLETEVYKMENERLDFDKLEERRLKDMLLARMNEIDKENQDTYSD
uniref:Lebercilin-like n=1 Tax=Geotrypetes seraphini TaxID=260995 RepID=A0A6P8Q226_GEOSA|nr:lebercilin-like [Geotrypetes seraphini]